MLVVMQSLAASYFPSALYLPLKLWVVVVMQLLLLLLTGQSAL
jgi:hypothetical protein